MVSEEPWLGLWHVLDLGLDHRRRFGRRAFEPKRLGARSLNSNLQDNLSPTMRTHALEHLVSDPDVCQRHDCPDANVDFAALDHLGDASKNVRAHLNKEESRPYPMRAGKVLIGL